MAGLMTSLPKRPSALALIALANLANASAHAAECPAVTAPQTATTEALSSILAATLDAHQARAIIFSAERNGVPVLRTAVGLSTDNVPATTNMHFRIGAVGWQYLATLLLETVDHKEITLNDPVAKWYPDYPNATRATVRELGASSTGFGDYVYSKGFFAEVTAHPDRRWTTDELVRRSLPDYQHAKFDDPGRDWDYTHTGFVMLGAILERVRRKPYDQLLREGILDPLGLHDTRLQLDSHVQEPVLHTLTDTDNGAADSTFWNPSWVSWGAMTSNICDLATWTRAFGAGQLLSKASRAETTAPVNVGLGPNTPEKYYGLGTEVHGGWVVQNASYWGMFTTTAYDPATGASIEVTASVPANAKDDPTLTRRIVWAASTVLAPNHPLPGNP